MKIAIIGINNSFIDLSRQNDVIDYIKFNMIKQGKSPSLISYFNNNIDFLRNTLNQQYDIVFFIGTDSIIFNNNIKDNIAKIIGCKLEKHNICEQSLMSYCSINNIVYSQQEELQTLFPTNSQPIFKSSYFDNGFTYKFNSTQIFFLPSNVQFVEEIYQSSLLPFINSNSYSDDNFQNMTIKCYGILEKDLRTLLSEELINPNLDISIVNCRLDNAIYIRYDNNFHASVQPVIADICSKLSKLIYATEDISLYKTATNLLNIQNKRISIAETITKGNITTKICNIDNSIIDKGIIVSTFDSIAKHLKIQERIVNQFGKYSVNTVYELNNLLLEQSNSDISIFVLGDKSVDTCYIAIGDIEGIHVYKNKVSVYDNTTSQMLSETTMFYLIKKLRQNDLQFR